MVRGTGVAYVCCGISGLLAYGVVYVCIAGVGQLVVVPLVHRMATIELSCAQVWSYAVRLV